MESVNINGERHRIHTYSVQYSQSAIFFLTLPTELVHKIRAQYSSSYCESEFTDLHCEFISIQWSRVISMLIY
jgi:hypothetical protein